MNTELLLRVQQIDPAPPEDAVPDGVWDAQELLEQLHRRTAAGTLQLPGVRRRWRIAATAVAVVLVLIGGLALLRRGQNGADDLPDVGNNQPQQSPVDPESDGQPTPITVPGSPTTVPRTIVPRSELPTAGSLSTPLGPAEWVRIPGDGGPRPLSGSEAIEWPSGFAIFHAPSTNGQGQTQLVVSDDGTDWRTLPIPTSPTAENASLSLVEGVYWLISTNPNGIWRSSDGLTWDEFDADGLSTPGPSGFNWIGAEYSRPVTVGALTFSHASFTAAFPFADYAGPNSSGCERLVELRPGEFGMVADEGTCPSPVLRFVETATGLQVIDNSTNAQLGEIDGANLTHIDRFALFDELQEESLLLIADGGITQVPVPWADTVNTVTLLGTTDWVYAYVQGYTGGQDGSRSIAVWRSSDGRSWIDLGTPSFLRGAPIDSNTWFTALSGVLAATNFDLPIVAWETTDGVTWTPVPEGRPPLTYPVRLESGWFANDGSQGGPNDGDAWWMHVDGEWVSLAELGMEHSEWGCNVGITAIETTTFFFGSDCFPTTNPDLWVLNRSFTRGGE